MLPSIFIVVVAKVGRFATLRPPPPHHIVIPGINHPTCRRDWGGVGHKIYFASLVTYKQISSKYYTIPDSKKFLKCAESLNSLVMQV